MHRLLRFPIDALNAMLIALVRGYQYCLRPILPPSCKYEPGCSEYFIGAVRKHGPIIGCAKGTWRICRCNPWCAGGYDPP